MSDSTKYGVVIVIDEIPEIVEILNSEAERNAFADGAYITYFEIKESIDKDILIPETLVLPLEIFHSEGHFENYFFRKSSHPRNYDGPPVSYEKVISYYGKKYWQNLLQDVVPPEIDWRHPVLKTK